MRQRQLNTNVGWTAATIRYSVWHVQLYCSVQFSYPSRGPLISHTDEAHWSQAHGHPN